MAELQDMRGHGRPMPLGDGRRLDEFSVLKLAKAETPPA